MAFFPGTATGRLQRGVGGVGKDVIVLLRQDEISQLAAVPAGLIVVEGAPFSHSMIALLALGVPTVLVGARQAGELDAADDVLINGITGEIVVNPAGQAGAAAEPLPVCRPGQPVTTPDGVAVYLRASVRGPAASQEAVEYGAAAVGLVRTEFLQPASGGRPDRAYYRQVFRDICSAAAPLSVAFRLLDVAADKIPDWLRDDGEIGRPLGRQGVRLYDTGLVGSVIEAQLGAITALAEKYPLQVIIPYLTGYEELNHWLAYVRRRVPADVPVGAMVEIPAAALDVERWLGCADFLALGCNDLMQCLFAADRDAADLHGYLDPYAPVLFRFLRLLAEMAGGETGRLQLCGLLSQLPGVLPVLLGLGYRVFSVDAPFIPYLARSVAATRLEDSRALALRVCAARESRAVKSMLGVAGG